MVVGGGAVIQCKKDTVSNGTYDFFDVKCEISRFHDNMFQLEKVIKWVLKTCECVQRVYTKDSCLSHSKQMFETT